MNPIDIPAIEARARQLRAAEIRRMNGLFADRVRLMARLAAGTVLSSAIALSEMVRPFFSWDPQTAHAPASAVVVPVAHQIGKKLFKLFSWNPQARRAS